MGGTDELPGTPWTDEPWSPSDAFHYAPLDRKWEYCGQIRHIFSHFTLYLDVYKHYLSAQVGNGIDPSFGSFRSSEKAALSGVMMKCLQINR
ncbi:hypothetical protein AA15669_0360 [Saccharibacter floricola DSM 15669]|uniref:Adenine glycosylase n=1 Tax=Saccharibacter floricola DSM 15669 TaxID=1123227 RepID=A0ABQ0P051_9PROT|nr:hypothetical protein AA15669_0360 [Saccharibacter floricola DSM 15669]